MQNDVVCKQYQELAESAARRAGECLLDAFTVDAGVESTQGKDIKTKADRAAESIVLETLESTGLPILSEESGLVGYSNDSIDGPYLNDGLYWIVDPLDGTFNFVREFPICCVSIALWSGDKPVCGVIYDFVTDKLYSGIVGVGAWCNEKKIFVSEVVDRSQAVLATGFPSARDYGDVALADAIRSVQEYKKIRMVGSAAASLAFVATGQFDAYSEEDIWLWDVAAGIALVKSAGGDYRMTEPRKSWQVDVFASNGQLGG